MQPRLGQTLGRTDRKRFLPPSATQLGFAWVLTQFLGVFSQFSPLPAAVGTSCDPAGLSEQQPPLGFARLTLDPLPLQIQSITVTNQEFGLSQDEPTQPFYFADFDGILGMAYPSLAVGGMATALEGMLEQNQLAEPVFSFYFSR